MHQMTGKDAEVCFGVVVCSFLFCGVCVCGIENETWGALPLVTPTLFYLFIDTGRLSSGPLLSYLSPLVR